MDTAFFIVSKIFWTLATPGNFLLLLLGAGAALLFTRRARLGRVLVVGATAALGVVAIAPLGDWALNALEERFPKAERLPERIDGIVVLGGSVDQILAAARGEATLTSSAERLAIFVELALRYPEAKLVFTGGSGRLLEQNLKEAEVVRRFFRQIGFDDRRVLYEEESRNTWENALLSKDLADPRPGETWLLVTSAFHMPRAVGAFSRAGWDVTPVPTDYRTEGEASGLDFDLGGNLQTVGLALHEAIGLVAYRLSGRSDAFFPRPE